MYILNSEHILCIHLNRGCLHLFLLYPLTLNTVCPSFFQGNVRHFVKKLSPHFPNCPPECPLDRFLTLRAGQKHLISVIYIYLISALNEDPTVSLRESWEHELGISVTDDQ